jgi:hypothetical protein
MSKAIRALGLVFLVSIVAGTRDLAAQAPGFGTINDAKTPLISEVPQGFVGTWHWTTARQPCGPNIVDSYGNNVDQTAGRPFCQWPGEEIIKHMNGRGRAWLQFTRGDDAISPKYTCVAGGLGTALTEGGYLRTFEKRADSFVMHFEQSNWWRWIWMDGRKHPPLTDVSYTGHAIGWMEGKTLVVETTNLTWDPDGYDDHSHIARSHMAKFTERYTLKDKDSMELSITVDDPLFLKEPVTFVGALARINQQHQGTWDCDPTVALRELFETYKNPYPDDTLPERLLNEAQ